MGWDAMVVVVVVDVTGRCVVVEVAGVCVVVVVAGGCVAVVVGFTPDTEVDVDDSGTDVTVVVDSGGRSGSPLSTCGSAKKGAAERGWSVTSTRTAPTAADAMTTATKVAPSQAMKSSERRGIESLSDVAPLAGLTGA